MNTTSMTHEGPEAEGQGLPIEAPPHRLPDGAEALPQADLLRSRLKAAQGRVRQLEKAIAVAAQSGAILQDFAGLVERLTAERDAARLQTPAAAAKPGQGAGLSLATLPQAAVAEAACETLRAALGDAAAAIAGVVDAQQRRHAAIGALATWMNNGWVLLSLLRRTGPGRVAILQQKVEVLGLQGVVRPDVCHWLCRRRTLLGLLRRSGVSRVGIVVSLLFDADPGWAAETLVPLAARLRGSAEEARAMRSTFEQVARENAALRATLDRPSGENQLLQRRFDALEKAKIADEAALLEARVAWVTLRAASSGRAVGQDATGG